MHHTYYSGITKDHVMSCRCSVLPLFVLFSNISYHTRCTEYHHVSQYQVYHVLLYYTWDQIPGTRYKYSVYRYSCTRYMIKARRLLVQHVRLLYTVPGILLSVQIWGCDLPPLKRSFKFVPAVEGVRPHTHKTHILSSMYMYAPGTKYSRTSSNLDGIVVPVDPARRTTVVRYASRIFRRSRTIIYIYHAFQSNGAKQVEITTAVDSKV